MVFLKHSVLLASVMLVDGAWVQSVESGCSADISALIV